jgi:lipopolysaccharide export system protein LptA
MNRQSQVNLIFLLFLLPLCCFSLPADNKKPVYVKANSAEFSNVKHKGIYIGNVELSQGTTHLNANRAATYGNSKNQLTLAVAYGNKRNQAHYWTLSAPQKPKLHAYADKITYYPQKNKIILVGNAKVKQGEDSYSAPTIEYNTKTQHVISTASNKGRTVIVINPKTAKA